MARALLPIELSYSPLEMAFQAAQSYHPALENFTYDDSHSASRVGSYGNRSGEAWELQDMLILHIHAREGGCAMPSMLALDAVAAMYLRERVYHSPDYPRRGIELEPQWTSKCGQYRGWDLHDYVRVRHVEGGAWAWTPVGADTPQTAMRDAVAGLEQCAMFP